MHSSSSVKIFEREIDHDMIFTQSIVIVLPWSVAKQKSRDLPPCYHIGDKI